MFLQNNGFSLEDDGVYVLDLKEEKRTKLMLTLQQRPIAAHLPENGLPMYEQMKTFYNAAQDILNSHQLPITKYDHLKIKKSVMPRKFHDKDVIKVPAIGNIIMSFKATNIPPENKTLQSIAQSFDPIIYVMTVMDLYTHWFILQHPGYALNDLVGCIENLMTKCIHLK